MASNEGRATGRPRERLLVVIAVLLVGILAMVSSIAFFSYSEWSATERSLQAQGQPVLAASGMPGVPLFESTKPGDSSILATVPNYTSATADCYQDEGDVRWFRLRPLEGVNIGGSFVYVEARYMLNQPRVVRCPQ